MSDLVLWRPPRKAPGHWISDGMSRDSVLRVIGLLEMA